MGLNRRILRLTLPALVTLAADPLLSLVDTIFVSRIGTDALGSLGIDAAVFGFAFGLFNFLAYATTPLIAQALGAGDRGRAGRIVVGAIWLGLGLGALAAVFLELAARGIVDLMQAGPTLVEPAVTYLRVRALAAPAVLVVTASHGAFRGLQDTATPLLVTAGVNVINALLDPFLIFGLDLGIGGAAIASVVAQWIGAIWFVILLYRRSRRAGWALRLPSAPEMRSFLSSGSLLSLRTLFLLVALAWTTAVAAGIGPGAVAAHQVVRETWFLTAMVVDGLAIAAQALVAEQIGRGDEREARRVSNRLFSLGLVVGLGLAAAWVVGSGPLSVLFAPEPAVGEAIRQAALVAAIGQPVAALVFVADGIFMAGLAWRRLVVSTGGGLAGAGLVLLATDLFGWGLPGVWWAITAMIVVRGGVLGGSYLRRVPV
jgi:MATE family multidrug resistance protein